MSANMRDRRIRIYDYTDADQGQTGVETAVYVFQQECWATVRDASTSERTVAGRAQRDLTTVFTLAASVVVPTTALIQIKATGQLFRVTGPMTRGRFQQQVGGIETDEAEYTLVDTSQGISGTAAFAGASSFLMAAAEIFAGSASFASAGTTVGFGAGTFFGTARFASSASVAAIGFTGPSNVVGGGVFAGAGSVAGTGGETYAASGAFASSGSATASGLQSLGIVGSGQFAGTASVQSQGFAGAGGNVGTANFAGSGSSSAQGGQTISGVGVFASAGSLNASAPPPVIIVGDFRGAGSAQGTNITQVFPGQNMPPGYTVVVNTGDITTPLPSSAQVNGGTFSWTGPTGIVTRWTNFGQTVKDSSGSWAGNWQTPLGGVPGLDTIFDQTLQGGAEPLRLFIDPYSSPGTGFLYFGVMITLSTNWNYSKSGEVKIFNPITVGGGNNDILTLTSVGASGNQQATGAAFPHLFLQGNTSGYIPSGGPQSQSPSFVSGPSAFSNPTAANFFTFLGQPTCLEYLIQPETSSGANNGNVTIWVNGVNVYDTRSLALPHFNLVTGGGWHNFGETNDFGGDSSSDHPPASMRITRNRYFVATK
jgi:hypothetical protein